MTDDLNINPSPELSPEDAELLSAYMDDMLTATETADLEARLEANPFLRAELSAMRQTSAWINELPILKAPRDFTITAEQVYPEGAIQELQLVEKQSNIRRLPPYTGWIASIAAVFVIVIVGALVVIQPMVGDVFENVNNGFGGAVGGAPAADVASVPEEPSVMMDTSSAEVANAPTQESTTNNAQRSSNQAMSAVQETVDIQRTQIAEAQQIAEIELTATAQAFAESGEDVGADESAADSDMALEVVEAEEEADGDVADDDAIAMTSLATPQPELAPQADASDGAGLATAPDITETGDIIVAQARRLDTLSPQEIQNFVIRLMIVVVRGVLPDELPFVLPE